ncbi:MAG: glycosyl transferase family 28 [Chitinophagaceae bacterium]|nr:glycosyl transferase family 28 [Chitinophagaceae bacterium]
MRKPNVVIALLDWGLGHTTRSIPIINHLLARNCNITVACNATQKALLINEFPDIRFENLEGYNLHYGKTTWKTITAIIFQARKILINIKLEHKWLHEYVEGQATDLIISDNRFGFYHPKIKSVFITHQLRIRTGLGPAFDSLIQRFNYRHIQNYQACFVPDTYSMTSTLAGDLSHPVILPRTATRFIGPLSRFATCTSSNKYDGPILILLSGPEPQRTILEEKIVRQLSVNTDHIILVRGKPGDNVVPESSSRVKIFNHLPALILNQYLCSARFVVSRAGYTSIMDYMKLGIKSILIPTPGQAEQEYLAEYLHSKKYVFSISQKAFDLNDALAAAGEFDYHLPNIDMNQYQLVLDEFLEKIQKV